MRRDTDKRESLDGLNEDEFQAYGEYSYTYLHQNEQTAQGEPEATRPPEAAPPTAEKVRRVEKRRRSGVFFKLLGLLTALTVLVIVLQETVFRLETVYVVGNQQKTPQQIVMLSGLKKGRNIFTIDQQEVARSMAQDHTIIFKGMQIEYPSTVYLYVEERRAVAVMRWLGNQFELDVNGLVMTESDNMTLPQNMPLITGLRATNAHEGQQLMVRSQQQMEAYHDLMSELDLQLYADQVTEINLSNPDNIFMITADGVTVRLGDGRYMRAKVGAVRTCMAYLRQLGKDTGVLDVSIPEDAKFMPED